MKVIVFGGTGWVGHHIVKAFHKAGHDVTICSRGQKDTYLDDLPEGLERVQADKNAEGDVARVFERPCDVVVDSVPTEQSIDNITACAGSLKRYVHCSSTGGYAPLPFLPGDEAMPYEHFMGGWKQKAVVDAKVLDLHRGQGFPATVIRPCYITGPGLLPLDNVGGRREDFIPDILEGNALDLPNDGQALLQPIHVEDLANAFLLAALEPGSVGQVYNICLDKAVTIQRYVEITAKALGRDARINLMGVDAILEKHGESVSERGLRFFATHMCYDISRAKEDLGYRPKHTTQQAIEETALWGADQTSPGWS